MPANTLAPSLLVRIGPSQTYTFHRTFQIGRDDTCDIVLDSGLVSRIHARVDVEEGRWCIHDLQSTNGTYVNNNKVSQVPLTAEHLVQFGHNGPILEFSVQHSETNKREYQQTPLPPKNPFPSGNAARPTQQSPNVDIPPSTENPPSLQSIDQYIDHYFGEKEAPAGEHTQFIRTAYKVVQARQQKRFLSIVMAIAVVSIAAILFALFQNRQRHNLEELATEQFYANKQLDLRFANIQKVIENSGVDLEGELELLQSERADNAQKYDGYIRELGLYRELSPKERAIYDMARIFNESGFGMPATFVGEVLNKIENHWLGPHRGRFIEAIQRAEQVGYTGHIVQAMHERGLPPEFFYLALQESNLRVDQSGPRTRWGIAKGMWQFIPSTATRFGLQLGPRIDQRVHDTLDERHDFQKSTDAAARYLQELYSTLAQASGLLVMASYNWGEHRIAGKLSNVPGDQPLHEEIFAGIPQDPRQRNYWAFLTTYKNRMPEETKNYVLEIFSAAVIGHNPRLWGLDMDNPLQHHIEALNP